VDSETTVGRKPVEGVEAAIEPKQENKKNVKKVGLTTTTPETPCEEMLKAIRQSLMYLATTNDG